MTLYVTLHISCSRAARAVIYFILFSFVGQEKHVGATDGRGQVVNQVTLTYKVTHEGYDILVILYRVC